MAQDPYNRDRQPQGRQQDAPKSATRKTLRFLFNPEFGRSASSIGNTFQMFVQMLALLFVSNGTLPRTHPFFQSGARFTMGDLFRETHARIEWQNRAKLPQTVFFCAVWGLLTSAILYLVTFVLLFVAAPSQAHAQPAQPPTPPAASGSMFAVPDTDLAIQFIRNMVMGEPIAAMQQPSNTTIPGVNSTGPIQAGLRAMLGFYSSFILVIASFLLLYHIVMLITKSAWSGKPLEGANAIWGPLRLVIAIGLLVPLSNNLNAGQYAVLKMAEMGSGLATNGWNLFVNSLAGNRNYTTPSINPRVKDEYAKMVMVFACMYNINYSIIDSGATSITDPDSATTIDQISGKFNGVNGGNDWMIISQKASAEMNEYSVQMPLNNDRCGKIQIPRAAAPNASATASGRLVNDSARTQKINAIRAGLSETAEKLMQDARATAKLMVQAKRKFNGENPNDTTADNNGAAVQINQKIRRDVITYVQTSEAKNAAAQNGNNDISNVGYTSWIMAGAFFYQIASYQNGVYSAFETLPEVELGDVFGLARKSNGLTDTNMWSNINTGTDEATPYQDNFLQVMGRYSSYLRLALGGSPDQAITQDVLQQQQGNTLTGNAEALLGNVDAELPKVFGMNKSTFISMFDDGIAAPYTSMLNVGQFLYNHSLTAILVGVGLKGTAGLVARFKKVGWIGDVLNSAGGLVITIGVYMFLLGVFLCFFMPLIPAIKFLMDGISWFLAIFEAIIGMPLLALAHLTPGGDGLLDPVRHGYSMLLHIMIKPILMVMAMIIVVVLVTIALFGLNAVFVPTFDAAWGTGDVGFITAIVLLGIWVFNVYSILNACYKFIDHLPSTAMNWFGSKGHDGLELERHVNPLLAQQYLQSFAKGAGGAATGLGNLIGGNKAEMAKQIRQGKAKGALENQMYPEDKIKEDQEKAAKRAVEDQRHQENIDATNSYHPYFQGGSNLPPSSGGSGGNVTSRLPFGGGGSGGAGGYGNATPVGAGPSTRSSNPYTAVDLSPSLDAGIGKASGDNPLGVPTLSGGSDRVGTLGGNTGLSAPVLRTSGAGADGKPVSGDVKSALGAGGLSLNDRAAPGKVSDEKGFNQTDGGIYMPTSGFKGEKQDWTGGMNRPDIIKQNADGTFNPLPPSPAAAPSPSSLEGTARRGGFTINPSSLTAGGLGAAARVAGAAAGAAGRTATAAGAAKAAVVGGAIAGGVAGAAAGFIAGNASAKVGPAGSTSAGSVGGISSAIRTPNASINAAVAGSSGVPPIRGGTESTTQGRSGAVEAGVGAAAGTAQFAGDTGAGGFGGAAQDRASSSTLASTGAAPEMGNPVTNDPQQADQSAVGYQAATESADIPASGQQSAFAADTGNVSAGAVPAIDQPAGLPSGTISSDVNYGYAAPAATPTADGGVAFSGAANTPASGSGYGTNTSAAAPAGIAPVQAAPYIGAPAASPVSVGYGAAGAPAPTATPTSDGGMRISGAGAGQDSGSGYGNVQPSVSFSNTPAPSSSSAANAAPPTYSSPTAAPAPVTSGMPLGGSQRPAQSAPPSVKIGQAAPAQPDSGVRTAPSGAPASGGQMMGDIGKNAGQAPGGILQGGAPIQAAPRAPAPSQPVADNRVTSQSSPQGSPSTPAPVSPPPAAPVNAPAPQATSPQAVPPVTEAPAAQPAQVQQPAAPVASPAISPTSGERPPEPRQSISRGDQAEQPPAPKIDKGGAAPTTEPRIARGQPASAPPPELPAAPPAQPQGLGTNPNDKGRGR